MYLIVGLGNPENEYAHTRHNMGFDAINEVAEKNNINITKSKFKGLGVSTDLRLPFAIKHKKSFPMRKHRKGLT